MTSPRKNVVTIPGDIFRAPSSSVLIHACNCLGSWGSGIASAFRELYPSANDVYVQHCEGAKESPDDLLGTCLLIPPQSGDGLEERQHWIACLFTSKGFGRNRDPVEMVLENTDNSLKDLKKQVEELRRGNNAPNEWHACKINSARFGVPWERTLNILEGVGEKITVYEYDESAPGKGRSGYNG
ncbi:ADP-ribose 1''-phosphate phosphatase [Rhizina undulata]